MNQDKHQYEAYANAHAPKSPLLRDCTLAFLCGGTICALAQGLEQIYEKLVGMTLFPLEQASPTSRI